MGNYEEIEKLKKKLHDMRMCYIEEFWDYIHSVNKEIIEKVKEKKIGEGF